MKTLIRIEDVHRAYSGKPGCMCGCKGTYYGAGSRVANKVVGFINQPNTEAVVEWDFLGDDANVSVTYHGRFYVLYFRHCSGCINASSACVCVVKAVA